MKILGNDFFHEVPFDCVAFLYGFNVHYFENYEDHWEVTTENGVYKLSLEELRLNLMLYKRVEFEIE